MAWRVLYDVGRLDPATYAAVALTIVAAGLLASWLPARRAPRVDPVIALRSEWSSGRRILPESIVYF